MLKGKAKEKIIEEYVTETSSQTLFLKGKVCLHTCCLNFTSKVAVFHLWSVCLVASCVSAGGSSAFMLSAICVYL